PGAAGAPGDGAPGAAGAAGWWRRVDAWASPSDDLVAQRAWASSKLSAAAWLDRRPRALHRLASTRRSDTPQERERLWRWAESKSGLRI
ncbi:MAG TPA: hypothetical protein PKU97_17270, partial [Kofleriaceae bacterium]|nr:hypothetical protein [Kofleriaceae bacterium]